MLSRLLRPFTVGQRLAGDDGEHGEHGEPSPGPSNPAQQARLRYATADFTEADDDDDDDDDDNGGGGGGGGGNFDDGMHAPYRQRSREDEDGLPRSTSVLPLFSATHLDSLPVYSITHAIRIIVQARTETTLTWEQLRSPQVSQFLVKPMQQQIRTQHFTRATLYALMANCLQFAKEGQMYPGNAGASSTRAKVCELLALKLLKEYSTRELIDALAYDFYPLQGLPGHQTPLLPGAGKGAAKSVAARTSTLEVAIRASAKHFLAHPLVVQQLEAIWNGAISFYSAADNIHRHAGRVGTPLAARRPSDPRTPLLGGQPGKETRGDHPSLAPPGRRTVTLYDPRNASLFKLSRLRVPRYRQFLSTCSLAVLIGLFLAVLVERSASITTLELVFWFWSAGFMLDELVGFTEQGFSLYIMSFWNIFDLGILLLLVIYYCMRIYGVFLVDSYKWNDNAYDILAANAILLLPRIFSALDHHPYFSQLLIAFRLMAVDLAAVFVLVVISCSGFFVFFTLSRNDNDAGEVAFRIFQLLMGFTPAAWEMWPQYDYLERVLMALFLIICHFVVVTILITVLTNSFMAIASNATEEHQFLFAINTISMVKNDALFSYVAPSNIFAWALMPLRHCLPLQQFVYLNRCVIKATHFPVLFAIYLYEKHVLAPSMFAPTDLVEHPGRGRHRALSLADPTARSAALFSPGARARAESVAGFQKDRALEEVFRRPPDYATLRTQRRNERRRTQTAVRNWMDQNDGLAESPHNYSTIDSRPPDWHHGRQSFRDRARRLRQFSEARSVASDPADLLSNSAFPAFGGGFRPGDGVARRDHAARPELKDTDAEGDDELLTNDEDDDDNATNTAESRGSRAAPAAGEEEGGEEEEEEDYFTTPAAARFGTAAPAAAPGSPLRGHLGLGASLSAQATPTAHAAASPRPPRRALHSRTLSTNTILYNPPAGAGDPAAAQHAREAPSSSPSPERVPHAHAHARAHLLGARHAPPLDSPGRLDRQPPRRAAGPNPPSRPRPIAPPRDHASAAAGRPIRSLADAGAPAGHARRSQARRLSSLDLAIDNHSDLAAAAAAAAAQGAFDAVPSSFVTQMAMATGVAGAGRQQRDDSDRMGRLVLARMKTLEESMAGVAREVRVLQQRSSGHPSTAHNSASEGGGAGSWRDGEAGRGGGGRGARSRPGTAPPSRPMSRRGGAPDERAGPGGRGLKGKGKEVRESEGDDSDDERGFAPVRSSY